LICIVSLRCAWREMRCEIAALLLLLLMLLKLLGGSSSDCGLLLLLHGDLLLRISRVDLGPLRRRRHG
jgi:hypothetical protein